MEYWEVSLKRKSSGSKCKVISSLSGYSLFGFDTPCSIIAYQSRFAVYFDFSSVSLRFFLWHYVPVVANCKLYDIAVDIGPNPKPKGTRRSGFHNL